MVVNRLPCGLCYKLIKIWCINVLLFLIGLLAYNDITPYKKGRQPIELNACPPPLSLSTVYTDVRRS